MAKMTAPLLDPGHYLQADQPVGGHLSQVYPAKLSSAPIAASPSSRGELSATRSRTATVGNPLQDRPYPRHRGSHPAAGALPAALVLDAKFIRAQ
jgi:hypothetical protein